MTTTCPTRSRVGASAKKRRTRLDGSAGLPSELDERSQDLTGEPASTRSAFSRRWGCWPNATT
ncbi:hypothetical protein SFR_0068 [Streptomyces sp. FR-008]|nr:hypothetical protein SFR_0068 [Streptomyces sp. FR-008]